MRLTGIIIVRIIIIGLLVGLILVITNYGCGYTFQKSTIESSKKATPSNLYALCVRSSNSKTGVGQNIRDCNVLLRDVTIYGKLDNYEKCRKIDKKNLNCKEIVFGKK